MRKLSPVNGKEYILLVHSEKDDHCDMKIEIIRLIEGEKKLTYKSIQEVETTNRFITRFVKALNHSDCVGVVFLLTPNFKQEPNANWEELLHIAINDNCKPVITVRSKDDKADRDCLKARVSIRYGSDTWIEQICNSIDSCMVESQEKKQNTTSAMEVAVFGK